MSAFDVWDELVRGGWSQLAQWRASAKPEGIHLDFKEANWTGNNVSDDDRKNLAKNLSGFGNVDGGVLLYGAATTTDPVTKLEVLNALKGVSPLDQYEERLRTYVQSSTVPPVPGVIVQKIENPQAANHGLVAVYIPLTDGGPFRAQGPRSDVTEKYFMRSTSDTLVMPHQILAAMFGRRPSPQLRVGVEKIAPNHTIAVHVKNVGRGVATGTFVRLRVHLGQTPDEFRGRGTWVDRRDDVAGSGWHVAFGHPRDEVLFPGESRIAGTYRQTQDERQITARIDCMNAQPVEVTRTVTLQTDVIEWFEP